MTRAQRNHDDALGKTTTPFLSSSARSSAAQLPLFLFKFAIQKEKASPFLVKRSYSISKNS
jgi:hypothetical protein